MPTLSLEWLTQKFCFARHRGDEGFCHSAIKRGSESGNALMLATLGTLHDTVYQLLDRSS